ELLDLAVDRSKVQRPLYHLWRIEAAARAGDAKEIARLTETLQALWPGNAVAWAWTASAFLESDPERARQMLDKALSLDPGRGHAWADLAVVALQRGEVAQADAACAKALSLQPDNVEALINHGVCRLEKGDPEAARAELAKAARLAPDKPGIHYHLARV